MVKCIICLGSNQDGEKHLLRARTSLDSIFSDIRWGEIVLTQAEGTNCPLPYHNLAAIFYTTQSSEQIGHLFKSLESEHGRTLSSKSSGIVPLDIDLLIYGDKVLKPDDFQKDYINEALKTIK